MSESSHQIITHYFKIIYSFFLFFINIHVGSSPELNELRLNIFDGIKKNMTHNIPQTVEFTRYGICKHILKVFK